MIDKKLVAGKEYSLPTVEIVRFDFSDVIRTSGEAETSTVEVGANYQEATNWDSLLGGMK